MNPFSWLFFFFFCRMGGGNEREQGSQLNPPCHSVPLCHSRYQFSDPLRPLPPPEPLPLISFDNLPKHFIFFSRLIRGDILRFSLVGDGLHLSPPFSSPSAPPEFHSFFFSSPHPLGRSLSASEQTASLCFLRAIRAQTKRLISLKPG